MTDIRQSTPRSDSITADWQARLAHAVETITRAVADAGIGIGRCQIGMGRARPGLLDDLGGFAGPAMIGWVKDQTGSYAGGLYFVAGLLMLSAVLTLLLSRSTKPALATTAEAAAH